MKFLGRQILAEFFGCSAEILNDVPLIESSMVAAAKEAGATVINSVFHQFSPFGVSGVVVIQESHLTIHTWPEYRYAAMDLFTCGDTVNPWVAFDKLKADFKANYGSALELNRGQLALLDYSDLDLGNLQARATHLRVNPKTSRHENAYHEMIIHVPMLLNPSFKHVLVIGGDDGGSLRELLRHPQIETVTLVEIDGTGGKAAKECFASLAYALEDSRVDLKIEDSIAFVNHVSDASYNLIVVDAADPVGPSEGLFRTQFYQQLYRCLKPGGAITAQTAAPQFNQRAFVDINHCLRGIFGQEQVFSYLAFIPTYPTGMGSFSYATRGAAHPLVGFDQNRSATFAREHHLQYYNASIHQAAFALPTFVDNMLGG